MTNTRARGSLFDRRSDCQRRAIDEMLATTTNLKASAEGCGWVETDTQEVETTNRSETHASQCCHTSVKPAVSGVLAEDIGDFTDRRRNNIFDEIGHAFG